MNRKQPGFTIVELLIVIVVIGILAAITIVAYNGIQERARISRGLAFANQIKKKHHLELTGNWQMDECNGVSVGSTDESSASGTINGTATWSTDTPSGSGCSLLLNGTTRVTTLATLAANYYFKAAWVKFNSCGGNNNIISSPDSGGTDAPLYAPTCRVRAGHHDGTNQDYGRVQSPNTLTTGKWYHIAVEFNNGTYRLYEDGKEVATTSGHLPVSPIAPGLNIGAHRMGSNLNGLIDDVIVVAK
ncbi:MAG TPA: LamG-like jellyroll fold domain-containing protein [Candidatus Saccharimonadales bacterium]|jgi:prepilin-type N-terminal cleavage/methylation domain-containing protein|nr:LamG-like jellyroll fold domain-containing protein [Candidatus Saccharimonadales bacterium]